MPWTRSQGWNNSIQTFSKPCEASRAQAAGVFRNDHLGDVIFTVSAGAELTQQSLSVAAVNTNFVSNRERVTDNRITANEWSLCTPVQAAQMKG